MPRITAPGWRPSTSARSSSPEGRAIALSLLMVIGGFGVTSTALPTAAGALVHAAQATASWADQQLAAATASLQAGQGPDGLPPTTCISTGPGAVSCAPAAPVPAAASPTPGAALRYAFAMSWDGADKYVLLFGGCSSASGPICPTGSVQGDTWTFASGKWTQLTIAGPNPRWGAAMAYDQLDNVVVLYGGCAVPGALSCSTLDQDTWLYAGGVWSQYSPTSPPGLLYFEMMTYDANDHYILMYGGCDQAGGICPALALTNTWRFTVATGWIGATLNPTPPARYSGGLANDTPNDGVLLFGGCGMSGTICPSLLSDTWLYSAGVWTNLNPANHPSGRYGFEMTWDATDSYILLMGGCNVVGTACPVSPLSDQWEWLPAPKLWNPLTTSFAPGPGYYGGLAMDPSAGYSVYLEGCSTSGTLCTSGSTAACTWVTAAGEWFPECAQGAAGGRYGESLAFDTAIGTSGEVVMFGGCGASSCPLSDTWTYAAGTWTAMALSTAAHPSARWDAAMTYDAADGYVLLQGGCSAAPAHGGCPSANILKDYWILVWNPSTSKGAWTNLCPGSGCTAPSARYDASMAYETVDSVIVLLGGNGTTAIQSDTWTFTGGVWTARSCTGACPGARFGAASMNYPTLGFVIVGGATATGVYADTWSYTLTGGWVHQTGITLATGRADAMIAYDPTGLTADMFGGCTSYLQPCPIGNQLGDTLKWGWTTVTGLTTSPPARANGGYVWDGNDNYFLVYGGATAIGGSADTWSYFTGAGTWTYQY